MDIISVKIEEDNYVVLDEDDVYCQDEVDLLRTTEDEDERHDQFQNEEGCVMKMEVEPERPPQNQNEGSSVRTIETKDENASHFQTEEDSAMFNTERLTLMFTK
jgi:hypothetical protein